MPTRSARQYRATAVLSVKAATATPGNQDVGVVARELVEAGLFELTGKEELIRRPGVPLRTVPGRAIAKIPDAATWFTQTWSTLRFKRERAWRHARADDAVRANPAEIMGVWGLGAVECFVLDMELNGGNPEPARRMWLAVEEAFREARLVEPRMPRDFWCEGAVRLFGYWPGIVGSEPGRPEAGDERAEDNSVLLGRAIDPYVGINADFTGIVVRLRRVGVGAPTLDDAVRQVGGDLLRIIRRFVETARGLDNRRIWNSVWVAALSEIEREIAAHRSGGAYPGNDRLDPSDRR